MTQSTTSKPANSSLIGYAVAGGSAVVTHLVVLYLLAEFIGMNKPLASAIGFLAAIPVNYLLQHRFAFASDVSHGKAFPRYVALVFITMLINTALFTILLKILPLWYVAIQVMVILVIFVLNFFLGKRWVFTGDHI